MLRCDERRLFWAILVHGRTPDKAIHEEWTLDKGGLSRL
jgi:hypothetical protein